MNKMIFSIPNFKNNKTAYKDVPIDIINQKLHYINPYSGQFIKTDAMTVIDIPYSDSFILESDILKNLPRGIHTSNERISIEALKSCILIIDFNNLGGGTSFFIESIINRYKKNQTFLIARNFNGIVYFTINDEYELNNPYTCKQSCDFLIHNKDKIEKIFVNHTLSHSNDFLTCIFNLDKHVTTITHDMGLLFKDVHILFDDNEKYTNDKSLHNTININNYQQIITQDFGNLYVYNNFISDKNKLVIIPLPDFNKQKEIIHTSNKNIVIGIIGSICINKGAIPLQKIIDYYKNTNIKIVVFGSVNIKNFEEYYPYNSISELNNLLNDHKPNMLLELSILSETYSYTLTLSMLMQLPILFFKKNGACVVENRLSKYNKAYPFSTIKELNSLIMLKKQDYFYTIEPTVYFNDWWDNYFITKKHKRTDLHAKNKFDINVYCTYFPQFHEIAENNVSFYPGFTDIINLSLLKEKFADRYIETPNLKEFSLDKITDYNLLNKKIVQKQIDIMCDYNISGLAIYYYWFSLNTITNKNEIMERVVNHFFDDSINIKNRKVFFIWANESWTDNQAFGSSSNNKIETEYSNNETFDKLAINLITYFKHNNYLKIDNKPVLSIHHPWCIGKNINSCFDILNQKCIENNYSGIHFIVSSMTDSYDTYINNHHAFDYKKSAATIYNKEKNQIYLDYKKYTASDSVTNKSDIYTLAFDFDNSARLIRPNKLSLSTICINNAEFNKTLFIQKIIKKYDKQKKSAVENILIVNAWNEWGEKMHMEPSNEYGYYNLNMLTACLTE